MPYSVLLWIPGKMDEPIFVTKVLNGEIIQAGVAVLIQLVLGRAICTTFFDLGHTCVTWLLVSGDSMCMCTSRIIFLHILLAKTFC